jgi:hypothetical protein
MKQPLLILITLVAAGSIATASPITYDINFTTASGLAPTSGSFTYDASTTTFSNFSVVWDTISFSDFTIIANTEGGSCGGSPSSAANAFLFLDTGCGGTRAWTASVESEFPPLEFASFSFPGTTGEIGPDGFSINSSQPLIEAGGSFTISPATGVPEPASASLFALGFAGFVMALRRFGARVQRKATA